MKSNSKIIILSSLFVLLLTGCSSNNNNSGNAHTLNVDENKKEVTVNQESEQNNNVTPTETKTLDEKTQGNKPLNLIDEDALLEYKEIEPLLVNTLQEPENKQDNTGKIDAAKNNINKAMAALNEFAANNKATAGVDMTDLVNTHFYSTNKHVDTLLILASQGGIFDANNVIVTKYRGSDATDEIIFKIVDNNGEVLAGFSGFSHHKLGQLQLKNVAMTKKGMQAYKVYKNQASGLQ